jgi:DNA-binding transcriptional MerR regulator
VKPKKMYYSISDVASLAKIKPYVLRYWETEFSMLKPKTMRGGRRAYRERDIKLVMMIKKLLYEDRFTIEGALRKLQDMDRGERHQLGIPFEQSAREATLEEVRKGLKEISGILGKALTGGSEEDF